MADDRLTRHMTVLHRVSEAHDNGVEFRSPDDSGADHVLWCDPEIWQDMGEPNEVTLTLHPDDQLNNPTPSTDQPRFGSTMSPQGLPPDDVDVP